MFKKATQRPSEGSDAARLASPNNCENWDATDVIAIIDQAHARENKGHWPNIPERQKACALNYLVGYRAAQSGVSSIAFGQTMSLDIGLPDARAGGFLDGTADKLFGTCRIPSWVRETVPDWSLVARATSEEGSMGMAEARE